MSSLTAKINATSASVAVHFQDINGDDLPASSGGSVALDASLGVFTHAGPSDNPTDLRARTLTPEIPGILVPGGECRTFLPQFLAATITLTPTAVVAPGAAVTYTVSVLPSQVIS